MDPAIAVDNREIAMPVDFSDRHEYVGASEASVILGLNPYQTAYELWRRKIDRVQLDPNRSMRIGNFLEPFVITEYELETGSTVIDNQREYADPSRRVRAHIDGRIEGEGKLLECKTVGEWAFQAWKNAIPDQYRIQIEVQSYLAGVDNVDMAILVGNRDFKIVEFQADRAVGEDIVARCSDWYTRHVIQNEPPPVTSDESRQIWQAVDESIMATPAIENDVYALHGFNADIRHTQNEVTGIKTRIQEYMKSANKLVNAAGVSMVDWSMVNPSKRISTAKLRAYLKTEFRLDNDDCQRIIDNSTDTPKSYRRFTVK